jgi:hypothetical protein
MSVWIIFFELKVYLFDFVFTRLGRSEHSLLSRASLTTTTILVLVAEVAIRAIQPPGLRR